MAYEFIPDVNGLANLTLSGFSTDLDLFILTDSGGECMSGSCLAYADQQALFPITAGRRYYLLVDGFMGAESDYTLTADCLELAHSILIPIAGR